MALALILLAGAGLLMRSYTRMQAADLGYEPERLIALHVDLPAARYPSPASRSDFLERLAENIRVLPGVGYARLASGLPPRGGLMFGQLQIEGREIEPGPGGFVGGWVSAGHFEAMSIPVLDGRGFTSDDQRQGANVVVINDRMAARHCRANQRLASACAWVTGRRGTPWSAWWARSSRATPTSMNGRSTVCNLAGGAEGTAGDCGRGDGRGRRRRLLLGRYLGSMVYEVSPSDPLTLGAVALVLCGCALLAAWMPARRAMRLDPMVALRDG